MPDVLTGQRVLIGEVLYEVEQSGFAGALWLVSIARIDRMYLPATRSTRLVWDPGRRLWHLADNVSSAPPPPAEPSPEGSG